MQQQYTERMRKKAILNFTSLYSEWITLFPWKMSKLYRFMSDWSYITSAFIPGRFSVIREKYVWHFPYIHLWRLHKAEQQVHEEKNPNPSPLQKDPTKKPTHKTHNKTLSLNAAKDKCSKYSWQSLLCILTKLDKALYATEPQREKMPEYIRNQ